MPGKLTAAIAATVCASAVFVASAQAEQLGARSGQGATTSIFAKSAPGETNVYEITRQTVNGVAYTKLGENSAPVTFAAGIGNHGVLQGHRCRAEGATPHRNRAPCFVPQ